MSKTWLKQHKSDGYYKMAKKEGYRSRAAYKLQQMDKKFKIIKKGQRVLDLGAAPGGWSQIALQIVGESGTVVGVDLDLIRPVPPAVFIQGDMTLDETLEAVLKHFEECDVVISDMSPNITGNYSIDQANSIYLATTALNVVRKVLRPGGNFLVKAFEGEDFQEYINKLKGSFHTVKRHSPPSSRNSSSEIYVICKGFRPQR
jgi:23S rRNA (uridine2552-2'-O)-methyltransferase